MDSTLPELVGLHVAPDAMVTTDSDGRIVLVNAQAERLFGYRQQELLRQPVDHLIPAVRAVHPRRSTGERELCGDRPAGAPPRPGGTCAGLELRGRRKDGSTFPAEVSLAAVGPDEDPVVLTAIRDMTEWVRLNSSRDDQARSELDTVLASAHDAIVGTTTTGVVTGWNPSATRIYGYTAEEMLGHPVESLFGAATPDGSTAGGLARALWRSATSSGQRVEHQGTHVRKDGSPVPVALTVCPVTEPGGGVIGVTMVSQDLGERRRAEASRLESLGRLAGGVAHDYNNLLAVILSYTSLVAEDVAEAAASEPSPRWESMRADLEQIQRATERASRLTHQLLAFGRREVARPEALDLNELIRAQTGALTAAAGTGIRLHTVLAPGPCRVEADAGHLEQVLGHVVRNAVEAMPTGGSLTVETARIEVAGAADTAAGEPGNEPGAPQLPVGAYVRLRVCDTGAGMTPEVRERAFEPFFTTGRKGTGHGLGLAAVHGMVTQAGGFVDLRSEPGRGTEFLAWLRATDAAPLPPPGLERAGRAPSGEPARRPPRPSGGGETVLLVEDTDALREATRRILVRAGYPVISCADGAAALRAVTEHQEAIDLLLTDVVMPGALGKEVARRVRELRPEIRVLFMSGYAHPVLASKGSLEPGVTLLEKPFSESALLHTVREVLQR